MKKSATLRKTINLQLNCRSEYRYSLFDGCNLRIVATKRRDGSILGTPNSEILLHKNSQGSVILFQGSCAHVTEKLTSFNTYEYEKSNVFLEKTKLGWAQHKDVTTRVFEVLTGKHGIDIQVPEESLQIEHTSGVSDQWLPAVQFARLKVLPITAAICSWKCQTFVFSLARFASRPWKRCCQMNQVPLSDP